MPIMMHNLDDIALDALREVGNIGTGNAMTALATLVDQRVDMTVPKVGIVPLAQFTRMAGGPESVAAGIYMSVTGDAPGHVAFLLPLPSACHLADQLLGKPLGTTVSLEEMECSALMEIGNILASSYLTALYDLTGLNLFSSPPAIAIDMTADILAAIATAFESLEDQALTIVTHIGAQYAHIEGFFIYVPEPGSLSIMLRALQIEVE